MSGQNCNPRKRKLSAVAILRNLSGYWSRRIDDFNRIVYRIDGETIEIVQCGTHYHR